MSKEEKWTIFLIKKLMFCIGQKKIKIKKITETNNGKKKKMKNEPFLRKIKVNSDNTSKTLENSKDPEKNKISKNS